jgi:hypothetical protein
MDPKDRNEEQQRAMRDRSDDTQPDRAVGERRDELDSDDDDLLPRRVVGEEPISDAVAKQVEAPMHANHQRADVYNLSAEALRADPYGEDLSGSPPLEDEPEARDLLPDQIQSEVPGAVGDDDVELTARSDREIRPIVPEELPEG